ncbi:hypothetical protein BH09BAC4_BH09BAC4_52180 [soil metagenome]
MSFSPETLKAPPLDDIDYPVYASLLTNIGTRQAR